MPEVTEPCERDKLSASDELTACHGPWPTSPHSG